MTPEKAVEILRDCVESGEMISLEVMSGVVKYIDELLEFLPYTSWNQ